MCKEWQPHTCHLANFCGSVLKSVAVWSGKPAFHPSAMSASELLCLFVKYKLYLPCGLLRGLDERRHRKHSFLVEHGCRDMMAASGLVMTFTNLLQAFLPLHCIPTV